MDVRVVLQLAAPGVQHAEKSRGVAAEALGIGGERFDGPRGGVE